MVSGVVFLIAIVLYRISLLLHLCVARCPLDFTDKTLLYSSANLFIVSAAEYDDAILPG
jgi:hypothetical protein